MGGKSSKAADPARAQLPKSTLTKRHTAVYTPGKIKELFDQADANRSGTLEVEEVRTLLGKLELPTYLADRMMQEADTDHNGVIDFDEFFAWATHKEHEIERLFDEIDVDRSKSISRDEFDRWLGAHGVKASAADEAKLMERFHKAPGGEITYSEFRDLLIFFTPTDFALLADDWMHHASADDLGVAVHTSSGKAAPKAGSGYASAIAGVAGGISAAISRTAVAPLERLRFQMISDGAKYGGSNVACLRGILKEEGLGGFWRGNAANMVRIFPQNGLMFFAKPAISEQIKAFKLKDTLGDAGTSLASGMVAGFVSQTAIYPLDVVRMRITTTPGVYPGIFSGLAMMARAEGVGALYRGLTYANMWAVPYTAVTFGTMDALKALAAQRGVQTGPELGCLFGAVAGAVSTWAAFPLESCRRKLQTQGVGGRPVLYSGIFDCMRGVAAKEGVMGLYAGCTANCIKMAPAQAITFGCMGYIKPVLMDAAGAK